MSATFTRRRMLKTLFCSSVFMNLNLGSRALGQLPATDGALELLALGDFGTGDSRQRAVAHAMWNYVGGLPKKPDGLLLLGDNFYGAMPGGVSSPRWMRGFSNMYPSKYFPCPCWPVLGNHDYHDNPKGDEVQLSYAKSLNRKTRWTLPARYYRVDLPSVTLLCIDTNWKSIQLRTHGKPPAGRTWWLSVKDRKAQMAWLRAQLASKRATFTIVVGHHPVYSDGKHRDTKELVEHLGPLLEKHGVHLYLCGHDHDLQHLELESLKTSFVISGGGGAAIYKSTTIRQGSKVLEEHGFTHLSVTDKVMTLRHINKKGKIVHAFEKHPDHSWKILT